MRNNLAKWYHESGKLNIEKRICSFDELPLMLTVKDVAEILGVCKANAYSLFHNENFPSVKVGNRFIVPRPAFVSWMANPKGG